MSDISLGDQIVYKSVGNIKVEAMDKKPDIDSGEVLIKVEASAICGTDIKAYFKGNPRIDPPMTMGHEFCGTIENIGENVNNYSVGQRVTMATTIGCGECVYCKDGKTNLCSSAEAMGFQYPGAMAPYVVIPEKAVRQNHLIDIGDLDAHIGAISEPLSCVMNGLSRIDFNKIKNVLIIGLGPLGLLHAVALKSKGINKIHCVEFHNKRYELAKKLGFHVYVPDEIEQTYLNVTDNLGFDLVIITAPHNYSQSNAPKFAKKGGYVSYFASLPVGDEMIKINSRTLHYNELIFFGTSDSTVKHVEEAVGLLKSNTETFRKIITHVLPLKDFYKAMDEIKDGNAVKVVLL